MHFHDSLRFCSTGTSHFFLYRTRCTANVVAQWYGMNLPLVVPVRSMFTWGGGGRLLPLKHPTPS